MKSPHAFFLGEWGSCRATCLLKPMAQQEPPRKFAALLRRPDSDLMWRVIAQAHLFDVLAVGFCLVFVRGICADTQPTLDELLKISRPFTSPPRLDTSKQAGPDGVMPDAEIVEALSMPEAADVFEQALRAMDRAARRLGEELNSGLETQRLHTSILAKLDQVIESAARHQDNGSSQSASELRWKETGSTQNAPSQPSSSATWSDREAGREHSGQFAPGSFEKKAATGLRGGRVEWGNLPDRLRDELLQGINERTSSVYKKTTEAYYQRLAEEWR